jgi:5'-deoxynucleotidase YfbR-like HD superfamily hydrolase
MSHIQLSNGEKHIIGETFIPDIESIAFALSHINRFTGHAGAYNVAQHSVLVAQQLPPELKLAGLLHDASEAYLTDISSPLKAMLPEYKKIETKYHSIIDKHFDVDTFHPSIKEVDKRILVTEAKSFGFDVVMEAHPNTTAYDFVIERVSAFEAYSAFLEMFIELTRIKHS